MDKLYIDTIHVSKIDKELLRNECKKLFLDENPNFEGLPLSDGFMFRRLVQYYLRE